MVEPTTRLTDSTEHDYRVQIDKPAGEGYHRQAVGGHGSNWLRLRSALGSVGGASFSCNGEFQSPPNGGVRTGVLP